MRRIKIKFVDYGPPEILTSRIYYKVLQRLYTIDESEHPDYVLCGGLGLEHCKYDGCVKIFVTSENVVPDFNLYDYAIASCHLDFGDRYLRVPYFVFQHDNYHKLIEQCSDEMDDNALLKRRFCSFVVSNSRCGDPIRREFFEKLSEYKHVDSGGLYLNNVGGKVKNKIDFCRGYKFNIAFENSSCPGYTTEKIVDAYLAHSLPIYYGDPLVESEFNPESMVRLSGLQDIDRAIDEIVMLDQDDEAYLKRVKKSCVALIDPMVYERRLEMFYRNIFSQSKQDAYRRCFYGWQQVQRASDLMICNNLRKVRNFRAKLGGFVRWGGGN